LENLQVFPLIPVLNYAYNMVVDLFHPTEPLWFFQVLFLLLRYRIIECLRNGEPLDQNVYEGCFWSAVTPLSAKSIKYGGGPQRFPDFTRGNWKTTKPLSIIL